MNDKYILILESLFFKPPPASTWRFPRASEEVKEAKKRLKEIDKQIDYLYFLKNDTINPLVTKALDHWLSKMVDTMPKDIFVDMEGDDIFYFGKRSHYLKYKQYYDKQLPIIHNNVKKILPKFKSFLKLHIKETDKLIAILPEYKKYLKILNRKDKPNSYLKDVLSYYNKCKKILTFNDKKIIEDITLINWIQGKDNNKKNIIASYYDTADTLIDGSSYNHMIMDY